MKKYRPNWQRIILLAIVINLGAVFVVSSTWTGSAAEVKEDNLQEIEWFEDTTDAAEAVQEISAPAETFPEIVFPPIEIPAIPQPILHETPPESVTPAPQKTSTDKPVAPKTNSDDDSKFKLKVISKVLPRDVIAELMSAGTIAESRALKAGKVVLAVTIGTDGLVKNVEIRRGGGTDEGGNLIDILSEAAAMRWIFEPFTDSSGQAKEIKTTIEFKPQDF